MHACWASIVLWERQKRRHVPLHVAALHAAVPPARLGRCAANGSCSSILTADGAPACAVACRSLQVSAAAAYVKTGAFDPARTLLLCLAATAIIAWLNLR
jgi:hypothetical protein